MFNHKQPINDSEKAKKAKKARDEAESSFLLALEDYIDAKVKAATDSLSCSPDDSTAGCYSFGAIEKARTQLSKTLDTLMETI